MSGPLAHFHFVTLFPEAVEVWFRTSILGHAAESGIFVVSTHQLRDFANDKHHTVDDAAYGGGGGMVLKIEPLVRALEFIQAEIRNAGGEKARVIYFSPAGRPLTQEVIEETLSHSSPTPLQFILVCGHYEGVDQRFIDHWVDLELSLGDFVLTGGEIPAVAFADAVARHLEGVLRDEVARRDESFLIQDPQSGKKLLEHAHYTRPADYEGIEVPRVLLSGDHGAIARWRLSNAKSRTQARRPDLIDNP